jgi:hypothetical protein
MGHLAEGTAIPIKEKMAWHRLKARTGVVLIVDSLQSRNGGLALPLTKFAFTFPRQRRV